MTAGQSLQMYRTQLALLTDMISEDQRRRALERHEAELRTACERAERSLQQELDVLLDIEQRLTKVKLQCNP